ncbi:MAG TPA: chemotaxis protein MotB [Geoalkalibacter subterraneus]|uniref:Chemotaxis protein MotB n=1 Tax=Geoalkalibacter subterraneus TaxID=483547 RepID=A0A831PIA1_9BACT|nr:chemotaxis protein MotB [Geoalkalibacter subterraneus]
MKKFARWGVLLVCLFATGCVGKSTYQAKVEEATELSARIADLQARMEQLEQDRREVLNQSSALERKLADALEKNSSLNQDLLRARANLDRSEKALSAKDTETGRIISEMRSRVDELEIRNRELSREVERERLARQARLAQMKSTYDELVDKLENEIERGEITISELQGKLTVNMVERILFDSGKADIKDKGLEVLSRVGRILAESTDRDIRVEGHTDNVPISPRLQEKFPTNWELSTTRATNVVHFLQNNSKIAPERLVSCGYGPYRPVESNDTAEGRAQNRRIQIVLAPAEPDDSSQ